MARPAKPKPLQGARAGLKSGQGGRLPPSNRERPAEPKRYKASKDELLEFYKQMLLIRRFEERAGQLYGLGLIGGFCHLYIGQEAVAVGLQSALEVGKDSVITGYRDHGHMLAYGIDPKVIMAELTGRAGRHFQGQGRLDAHVQRRAWLLRRPRHRRRAGQPRHRPRLQAQI